MTCDLVHDRPRRATLRVVVRSNRVGQPGRPMVRDLRVCRDHARMLRDLGIETVTTR